MHKERCLGGSLFPDLHHLRTKDFIYQVPKVELYSKKPMRLTFIERSAHDVDSRRSEMNRVDRTTDQNLMTNLQRWNWGIYIVGSSNGDWSGSGSKWIAQKYIVSRAVQICIKSRAVQFCIKSRLFNDLCFSSTTVY